MRSTQAPGVPNAQGRPYRPELSAEHGVTLVETLVSALVLIGVIFSVFATLDTATPRPPSTARGPPPRPWPSATRSACAACP